MIDEDELMNIEPLYTDIRNKLISARNIIYRSINTTMLEAYWYIGKSIYELQNGSIRAEYGKATLKLLSEKLTEEFGIGFSIQNLRKMRKFYELFPIRSTLSSELTWSHYTELIRVSRNAEREFYFNECINSKWSVRELRVQRNKLLYDY